MYLTKSELTCHRSLLEIYQNGHMRLKKTYQKTNTKKSTTTSRYKVAIYVGQINELCNLQKTIEQSCEQNHKSNYRTIVLQGGEDS